MLFKKKSVFLEKVEKIKTIKLFVIALLSVDTKCFSVLDFRFSCFRKIGLDGYSYCLKDFTIFYGCCNFSRCYCSRRFTNERYSLLSFEYREICWSQIILVRKMQATETMGACTVICTDKTGTLTKNQMEVVWSYVFWKRSFWILMVAMIIWFL